MHTQGFLQRRIHFYINLASRSNLIEPMYYCTRVVNLARQGPDSLVAPCRWRSLCSSVVTEYQRRVLFFLTKIQPDKC